MIRPGATSSASAGRDSGRALTSAPPIFFSLAAPTGRCAILAPGVAAALLTVTGDEPRGATRGVAERLSRAARCLAAWRGGAATSTGDSTVGDWVHAASGIASSVVSTIPADGKRERYIDQSVGLCCGQR